MSEVNATRNFSGALSTWKDIDLSALQKQLDAQGLELVENQKESLVGRKALADRTKDFKKLPEEEKPNAFKGLLKAYQTEIDALTKRSKASENAFLGVYKLLADAPDPYPLLEAAVDQTVKIAEAESLESEIQKLREENASLKRQTDELTTVQAALKKAESRAEVLEEKMEGLIQERVTQKENELNATYDEKLMNYEERERDLQRQITLAKDQLRDLRASNETNQAKLLNQNERQDQEVSARLAEMDMIAADLERANTRVAAVERRNEILRAEIESVRSGSELESKVKSLESQITEHETEAGRLLRLIEVQKETASTAEASTKRRLEEAARELTSRTIELDTLRTRLRQYHDYDEIKRELEIMKYVEFAGANFDDDDSADGGFVIGDGDVKMPNPNAQKANQQPAKSLEALVHSKNKRLEEELTKLRISHGDMEATLQAVTDTLAHTRADLDKQRSLNEKLEIDLLQLNPTSTSITSSVPPPANGHALGDAPGTDDSGLSGLKLGVKEVTPAGSGNGTRSGTPAIPFTAGSSADTSILPIVTNQRDRFRARNAELEEELRKQFETISDLRNDIKSLQQDNLKLYEKVRYMQSYRADDTQPASTAADDSMNRYKSMYEERMNPFEAFRGREQVRAVQALNPLERGVFILTRQILGNRRARIAFAVYAAALHLLVVVTLYECSSFGGGGIAGSPVSKPGGVWG
ncbi:hypothetical protein DL93DRAFT_2119954 [Clavulina sp. PMI_390]|nr:hypothetical protein DL93DRAFT_2119954 [Clavulina sp. PMI_390]